MLSDKDIKDIYERTKNNKANELAKEGTFLAEVKILNLYVRFIVDNNQFSIKQNLLKLEDLEELDEEDKDKNANRELEVSSDLKESKEKLIRFKEYEKQAIAAVEDESEQRVRNISYWFDELEKIVKSKKLVKKKISLDQDTLDYYKDFTTDADTIHYFLKLDLNNTDNIKNEEIRELVSNIMDNMALLAFEEDRPYSNNDMWVDTFEAAMQNICEEENEDYQEINDIESEIGNLEGELFEISPELIIKKNKQLDLEIKLATMSLRYACALGSYKENNYLYNEAKGILV